MTAVDRTYSIEEFMRLPSPAEGGYFELVDGELHFMSPAGGEHGVIDPNLIAALKVHVRENKLGRVFSNEAGFKLFPDRNTVRAPDVAFVAKGRLATVPEEYIPIPPDLAIEIVSPSDSWTEIDTKIQEYQRAGVRLIWVIIPKRKAVHVYQTATPLDEPRKFGTADTLSGEDVVPGFQVKVSDLFKAVK